MKKIVVLMLALCLAIPAISYAGSATSRWDLTIGGVVKFDVGWTDAKDYGVMQAGGIPARDTSPEQINDKYGNQFWGAGETGLNFFVRGPDALGAKTSAFISGDFTGVWGGSTYGTFDLVVATMTFDWANTSLMFGEAGGLVGMLPTFAGNQAAWGAISLWGGKGPAPVSPQVRLTQRFTKQFTGNIAVMANANNIRQKNNFPVSNNVNDPYLRAKTPGVQANVVYSSDACGKVGPWQLTLGVGGLYQRQKQVFTNTSGSLDDKDVDGYIFDFKVLVPIIPQRNDGNKAGALYADGAAYYAQGANAWQAGWGGTGLTGFYNRGTASDPEFATAKNWGYLVHAAFYFTDAIWINGFYMAAKSEASKAQLLAQNGPKFDSEWVFSLDWDASPATRFTLQWDHAYAKYQTAPAGSKTKGNANTYRFAAYYYF